MNSKIVISRYIIELLNFNKDSLKNKIHIE